MKRIVSFSFKREPVWMLVLSSVAPAVAAVLVIMLLLALKWLGLV